MSKDKKGLVSAIVGTVGIIAAALAAGKLLPGDKQDSKEKTDKKDK